jgi:hypothetical protein
MRCRSPSPSAKTRPTRKTPFCHLLVCNLHRSLLVGCTSRGKSSNKNEPNEEGIK